MLIRNSSRQPFLGYKVPQTNLQQKDTGELSSIQETEDWGVGYPGREAVVCRELSSGYSDNRKKLGEKPMCPYMYFCVPMNPILSSEFYIIQMHCLLAVV